MSRVNVDFTAIADSEGRFARLAQLLGLADADHARGKMEHLWMACTERGTTELPQWRVEQVFGERGPAALIESELARWSRGRGDSKTRLMSINGAQDRCMWLAANRDQSSKGGKARAQTSSRVAGKFVSRVAGDSTSLPTPTPTPTPVPSPEQKNTEPPIAPLGGGRRSRSKSKRAWSPEVIASAERVLQKLSEKNGVSYRSPKHVNIVAARLTEGIHELELRAVIAYCADEWAGKPHMEPYLRPSTLFGPEKVHEYLDPARARYADALKNLAKPEQPKLEVVK